MLMVAPPVEPMRRTLVGPLEIAPRSVRPEVHQESPAPQPQLRRSLMTVQASPRVHQSAQPVHRAVHRIARAMTSRVVISHGIGFRLLPQLRDHLTDGGGPGLGPAPLLKLAHSASEFFRGGGSVDVPYPTVQVV